MKNIKILSLVLLVNWCTNVFAQDKFVSDTLARRFASSLRFSGSKRSEVQLKSELLSIRMQINIMCHPRLNTFKDGDIKFDSIDNINLIKEELWIDLKYSYSWNLEGEFPPRPKASFVKKLLKRKDDLTDEEWKLLKYVEFYNPPLCSDLIDKFRYSQVVQVNKLDRYKVFYEINYNEKGQLQIASKHVERLINN